MRNLVVGEFGGPAGWNWPGQRQSVGRFFEISCVWKFSREIVWVPGVDRVRLLLLLGCQPPPVEKGDTVLLACLLHPNPLSDVKMGRRGNGFSLSRRTRGRFWQGTSPA